MRQFGTASLHRFRQQPVPTHFTIANDLGEVPRIQELIEGALQALDYAAHDTFLIRLAVEEARVNAIKHGNQLDPNKWVFVVLNATPERFDIRISDEGDGFDPDEEPDHWKPCGRGLLLMRGFMTEVCFHGNGNTVTMTKVREAAV